LLSGVLNAHDRFAAAAAAPRCQARNREATRSARPRVTRCPAPHRGQRARRLPRP
jgi:hypothetical protein